LSTPNDIEIMIHYHGSRTVHPRINAPAVGESIQRFLSAGLLVETDVEGIYDTTEGGRMYVEALCAVPLPVQRWVKSVTASEEGV